MTDHNREELIEALAAGVHEGDGWMSDAQNAQLEWDGPNRVIHFCGQGSIDVGHLAAIAEAVFEQAHTPTAHPAHSGHKYGGGYARAAALAAGDPDWMNATGGTPTDDEREALAELLRRVSERENPSWLEDADALLTAGFRRTVQGDDYEAGYAEGFHHGRSTPATVQGEPTDAIPDDDQIAADNADWHSEYTEPQGEASDVQVDAALRAYYKEPRGDWVNQFGPNMRAALRAAAEQGENR